MKLIKVLRTISSHRAEKYDTEHLWSFRKILLCRNLHTGRFKAALQFSNLRNNSLFLTKSVPITFFLHKKIFLKMFGIKLSNEK